MASQAGAVELEVHSVSTDTHFVHKARHDASDTVEKIRLFTLAGPTHLLSKAFGLHIDGAGDPRWIRGSIQGRREEGRRKLMLDASLLPLR